MRLQDEIVFITGSARGIGREIAEVFAAEGALVIISDINAEAAQKTAEEIKAKGFKADNFPCNVTILADVEQTIDKIIDKYGRIDILVNNAGITRDNLFIRMKEEDWDAVLDTNLKGSWTAIQAATKPMMKQRWGRIINIASVVGQMGNPGQANYVAAKAGLIGLTKSVARELASRNVTANAVTPGYIETAMTAGLSGDVKAAFTQQIPLGRMGTPEDIAAAVVFLASDEASYVTGQVLSVNGGLLMP